MVVALSLARLPRYIVLEPVSTVRFEVALGRPACEIDVEIQNPRPGRSFLLLIGPQGGPVIQRMRLTGRARLVVRPKDSRTHVLMLANPQKEPLVLQLRARRRGPTRAPAARARSRRVPGARVAVGSLHPRPPSVRFARPAAGARAAHGRSPGPDAGRVRAARPKG